MQEKMILTRRNVLNLITLAIGVFIVAFLFSGHLFMGQTGLLLPNWFFSIWGKLAILGFDILLVIFMFTCGCHKHVKSKMYLMTILLALSLAIAASSFVVQALAGSTH